MTALAIAALDLSLRATGVAWTPAVTGTSGWAIGVHTIRDAGLDGHERLHHVLTTLATLNLASAHLVVIERPFDNPRSPGINLDLGGLSWLVRHWLWNADVPYVLISPKTRAKYATGDGNADKATVLRLVRARYGSCVASVGNDNEGDALTLLALALEAYGQPLVPSAASQRAALKTKTITWPRLRTAAPEVSPC